MTYTAPARYVYQRAHHVDPDRDRHTACGLPMLPEELWQPVPESDVNAVCAQCAAPGSIEQTALI